ncbi:hypothetical protein LCGC14_1013660 [marine sediment metagenome]|uniref:Uncharacterized protein n=1 Tax=marine sediment metagenome TaxID=412755 RepID=A0A0F9R5I6_9ZZZZ
MLFVEDFLEDERLGVGMERYFPLMVLQNQREVIWVALKPWTYYQLEVLVNGIKFIGVGFARQRQYTSLIFRSLGKYLGFIPKLRTVLARKDAWNERQGRAIARYRAVDNAVVHIIAFYKRWKKGYVYAKPKEKLEELYKGELPWHDAPDEMPNNGCEIPYGTYRSSILDELNTVSNLLKEELQELTERTQKESSKQDSGLQHKMVEDGTPSTQEKDISANL